MVEWHRYEGAVRGSRVKLDQKRSYNFYMKEAKALTERDEKVRAKILKTVISLHVDAKPSPHTIMLFPGQLPV